MPDTFALTILFIVICTIGGAFIKGRSKDRCLKDFSGFAATLIKNNGKIIWGKLCVENSGLEMLYKKLYLDEKDDHMESSYILYKNEYPQIRAIVRYLDDLTEESAKKHEKILQKTAHPSWSSKLVRRTRNFFGTVRDSLLEVVNLFIGRMKTMTPAGKMLQGQDKYVNQLQQQATTAMQSAYEPILERYIGKKVVLAITIDDVKTEYPGILKDYTTEFIEIMDTSFKASETDKPRTADLIVPRSLGAVRHAGE
ncbi:MAG: hypothetical protein HQ594_01450 [Candidatus Omnitrophica bacterium]|nr:hypothetical protein [Candidatus Omnitrophota bacterium]